MNLVKVKFNRRIFFFFFFYISYMLYGEFLSSFFFVKYMILLNTLSKQSKQRLGFRHFSFKTLTNKILVIKLLKSESSGSRGIKEKLLIFK